MPVVVLSSVMVSLMNSPPAPVCSIVPWLFRVPPPNRWLSPARAIVPVLASVTPPGMLMLPPVHWNEEPEKSKVVSPSSCIVPLPRAMVPAPEPE